MKIEYWRGRMAEKKENKRLGRRWAKLYGILLKIHEEIDPVIQKQNEALEALLPEIRD